MRDTKQSAPAAPDAEATAAAAAAAAARLACCAQRPPARDDGVCLEERVCASDREAGSELSDVLKPRTRVERRLPLAAARASRSEQSESSSPAPAHAASPFTGAPQYSESELYSLCCEREAGRIRARGVGVASGGSTQLRDGGAMLWL